MRNDSGTGAIEPAMTAEEWAAAWRRGAYFGSIQASADDDSVHVGDPDADDPGVTIHGNTRNALAALCLHGQPFGFTREEVGALEDAVARAWFGAKDDDRVPLAERGIQKIRALLPPEEAE